MPSLEKQLQNAQVRRQIAEEKARAKYWQNVNANLLVTRKRVTGWTSPGPAERDFSTQDRRKAMAQARQLVDESPLALGLLRSHLAYVVGNEFRLSMRSGDPAWDASVEQWWDRKKDTIDVRGVRTWGRLLWCWQGRKMVDGDCGVILVEDQFEGSPRAWVQTVEADRIWKQDPTDAKDFGIDFDEYGKPVRYFVGPRDGKKGDPTRGYGSRYFSLLQYQPNERADMARGMSAFLCLLNLLKDLSETEDAMAVKVKKEAFIGLKFRTLTPDRSPFGAFSAASGTTGTTNSGDRPHVKLEPGLNINLAENEDAEVIESKSPNSDYQWFVRWRLRQAGMPWGLPLEYILFDSSEVNYSGLMTLAQMLKRIIRVHQHELKAIASRIFQWALAYEGLAVIGKPPAGLATWWDHAWGCPAGGFIDPQKEADSSVTLLNARLTTRQKVLADIGDGDDVDDIDRQLAKEQASAGIGASTDEQ